MSAPEGPARIVSLLPAATEIVAELGFGDRLVGRSHECDHPPQVADLPALTRPKLDPALPGGEIARRIRDLVEQTLSVFLVDAEELRALRPDLVLTQTQCAACAVSETQVAEALADWAGPQTRIVALKPVDLAEVWQDLQRVAEALEVPERGAVLIAELTGRLKALGARLEGMDERPSAVSIEWIDPLMAGGNWMPELIAAAGGRELLGRRGAPSHWITFEELTGADPEVLLLHPCGFTIERALDELPPLVAQPGWDELLAVRAGRVYILDGHRYFNRPGPRLVESAEILAEVLHPRAFSFGHEGIGWVRL
jgi:iron complex transport system substrate-binding protein